MRRWLLLLMLGIALPSVAAFEINYVGVLSTDYSSDIMVTIEFVSSDTLAVADAEAVALFDVAESSMTLVPVERTAFLPMVRFGLAQGPKSEEHGIFEFYEATPHGPMPHYVYNSHSGRLCKLNDATEIERRECFEGFEYYYKVENVWRTERAVYRDFQLYRVNTMTQERELLDHRPVEELFGGSISARTMIVDSVGDDKFLFLVGGAPIDGRPFVGTLAEDGTVGEVVPVEEAEGYTRNAAFVGDSHVAVPVDGEPTGGTSGCIPWESSTRPVIGLPRSKTFSSSTFGSSST